MSSDSEKDLDEIFGGIEDHIIEIEEVTKPQIA